MMKAVQIIGNKSAPQIVVNHSMAKPVPQDAEILVMVHAAGVTGDEILWPELYDTSSRIPGHEISGIVAAVGPNYCGPLKVSQEVFAFLRAEHGEGQAEYAICSAEEVAPKPAISHVEAAVLPIPFLTAWEAIAEHGKVTSGMKILVTGASGAVGTLFVQLATCLTGAHVIALASSQNHHICRQLGASEVVDYNSSGWEGLVTDVDLVFDTVGGNVLSKTWKTVKERGVIVTVADPPPPWAFGRSRASESASRPNVRYTHFIVSPNGERLNKASEMIENGAIKALAVKSFKLHEADHAWSHARRRNRGPKVVIDFLAAEKAQR